MTLCIVRHVGHRTSPRHDIVRCAGRSCRSEQRSKKAARRYPRGRQRASSTNPHRWFAARTAVAPKAEPSTPPALIAAAALYFLLSFGTAALGAIGLATGATFPGTWNIIVGIIYGVVAYWIIRRERYGYDWGIWSALLSLIGSVAQTGLGSPPIAIFIPFYVAGLVLLAMNRKAFNK